MTWLAAILSVFVLGGCGDGSQEGDTAEASAPTVTATETVTETVTLEPTAVDMSSAGSVLPLLELEVYQDGCGVIRSEAAPGVEYDNLNWVVRDAGGFQVLGRVAENETRYRYYLGGRYTVVLEAAHEGAYQTVSNEVTINC